MNLVPWNVVQGDGSVRSRYDAAYRDSVIMPQVKEAVYHGDVYKRQAATRYMIFVFEYFEKYLTGYIVGIVSYNAEISREQFR